MLAEVTKIKREVCKKYVVSMQQLEGPRRTFHISRARFEAYGRMRDELRLSFPEIGFFVGRRDHTSVIHGYYVWKKFPERFSKGWR